MLWLDPASDSKMDIGKITTRAKPQYNQLLYQRGLGPFHLICYKDAFWFIPDAKRLAISSAKYFMDLIRKIKTLDGK
jgi:hypothetical protein